MCSFGYTSGVYKHNDDDSVVQDRPKNKLQIVHIFTKFWWILQIYISQGSVATQLKCAGITNFPQNVPVMEKSLRLVVWGT